MTRSGRCTVVKCLFVLGFHRLRCGPPGNSDCIVLAEIPDGRELSLPSSGAVPGKAGKAAALPQFCKIESGGGPPYWWSYLARARAGGAAEYAVLELFLGNIIWQTNASLAYENAS